MFVGCALLQERVNVHEKSGKDFTQDALLNPEASGLQDHSTDHHVGQIFQFINYSKVCDPF